MPKTKVEPKKTEKTPKKVDKSKLIKEERYIENGEEKVKSTYSNDGVIISTL